MLSNFYKYKMQDTGTLAARLQHIRYLTGRLDCHSTGSLINKIAYNTFVMCVCYYILNFHIKGVFLLLFFSLLSLFNMPGTSKLKWLTNFVRRIVFKIIKYPQEIKLLSECVLTRTVCKCLDNNFLRRYNYYRVSVYNKTM